MYIEIAIGSTGDTIEICDEAILSEMDASDILIYLCQQEECLMDDYLSENAQTDLSSVSDSDLLVELHKRLARCS